MTLEQLRTQRIGILGFDRNNRGITEWLIRHNIGKVSVLDEGSVEWRPGQIMPSEIRPDPTLNVADWRIGPEAFSNLSDFDVLIRTPGVRLDRPELLAARAAGIVITSQTRLFFEYCPAMIIGVTGTKGKGTTASLIAAMLKADAGLLGTTYLAGNIGLDPFTFLDELIPDDRVVLELSSFQLEDLTQSPHVAVVLGITSDHLDYHRELTNYIEAKTPLVRFQTPGDFAVLDTGSAKAEYFAGLTQAQIWKTSRTAMVRPGVYIEWDDAGARPRRGTMKLALTDGSELSILRTDELRLRGEHNLDNAMAALAAAHCAGASLAAMQSALRTFAGYEHRLQLVGTVNGVACYDDSAATMPEPVIAAVKSFDEPVHLIVGGATKHADFTKLGAVIAASSAVTVTPLGTAEAPKIVAAIEAARQKVDRPRILPTVSTMSDAFASAFGAAKRGEVILLSPGGTGFDLFKSYIDRGNQFVACVQAAGEHHGA